MEFDREIGIKFSYKVTIQIKDCITFMTQILFKKPMTFLNFFHLANDKIFSTV